MILPLSFGMRTSGFFTVDSAFGLSAKANPVGTNMIVEIAKNKNPGVVFVTSKTKIQPAKGNSPRAISRGTKPTQDNGSLASVSTSYNTNPNCCDPPWVGESGDPL